MENSIHQFSKFSILKRQFGIRLSGGKDMFTKGFTKEIKSTRRNGAGQQTSKFASLVSLIKKLDDRSPSSVHPEHLEKAIRYTRPVDMGTIIRSR
jgi:hypothetical protein